MRETKEPPSKWTVMVYLAGDNNLSPEMIWALHEMAELGLQNNDLAITIQYDPRSLSFEPIRYALTSAGVGRKAVYEGTRETFTDQIGEKFRDAIPIPWARVQFEGDGKLRDRQSEEFDENAVNEDAANPEVLAAFIAWSMQTYPSRRRMLILSGHGSGAVGDFLPDLNGKGGRPTSLPIPGLAKALQMARDSWAKYRDDTSAEPILKDDSDKNVTPEDPFISILGMDSCLMSMAEVCHEVRQHVNVLVGSEGFALTTGWPYGHLFKDLIALIGQSDKCDSKRVAPHLVESYRDYYEDHAPAGISVDIAACDLSDFSALADVVKALAKKILDEVGVSDPKDLEKVGVSYPKILEEVRVSGHALLDLVVMAHWRAQSFKFEQYTDLWDFCNELDQACKRHSGFEGVSVACSNVQTVIEQIVDASSPHPRGRQGSVGIDYQYARGLSVYFPWSAPVVRKGAPLSLYRKLSFDKSSQWSNFLESYLSMTMRPERQRREVDQVPGVEWREVKPINEGSAIVRYSPEFNRYSPEFNRHLFHMYGDRLPWSMKNPPQRVTVTIGKM